VEIMSKYTVLLLVLSLICYSLAQIATNTTAGPESRPAGGVYVTPPNATFAGRRVVANVDSSNNVQQNEVVVFFTEGLPRYSQNVPQPNFDGNPDKAVAQNSNCFDGVITGDEVCDYALDTCCDTEDFCESWASPQSPCDGGPGVVFTETNLQCFTDICVTVPNTQPLQTKCTRSFVPAKVEVIPKRSTKKRRKVSTKSRKPIVISGTICYTETPSARRLDTRKLKKNVKGLKAKRNKKSAPTQVYCDGAGSCPCTTCDKTPVL